MYTYSIIRIYENREPDRHLPVKKLRDSNTDGSKIGYRMGSARANC